jgi:hypothetical protein
VVREGGEGARAMKRDDAPSDRSRCSTPPLALGNNNQLMMATGKDTTGNGEASEGGGRGKMLLGEGISCAMERNDARLPRLL